MASVDLPKFAIIAAGEMGSAVARRLTGAGCTVYTDLEGRSEETRHRAMESGMVDTPLVDIVRKADWILSILPPRDAVSFAEKVRDVTVKEGGRASTDSLVFADCNAVSPQTAKRIADIFASAGVKFIDASIIGGPPRDGYDPTIYASAASEDTDVLQAFVAVLSRYGLQVSPLAGESVGVGDASALKMSYSGINKGIVGLYTMVILAAHASSPARAEALIKALSGSQSGILDRMVRAIPSMLPKAYRWVGEMEEVGEFVGGKEGEIHRGLARIYERVEQSLDGDRADVQVLLEFVEDAKRAQKRRHD